MNEYALFATSCDANSHPVDVILTCVCAPQFRVASRSPMSDWSEYSYLASTVRTCAVGGDGEEEIWDASLTQKSSGDELASRINLSLVRDLSRFLYVFSPTPTRLAFSGMSHIGFTDILPRKRVTL